ncbi:hypothetical protein EZV62_017694 [Acer yangbiense]|uniref:Disease resistance protein At4g27190-like leucine-rich repeats domain-containing protein n=1 Tax=Acer yangbiense TaxID=1000413 RepID=A0A5C7HHB2_9ROSI|nr:hypothetical protein EZV62_017694 [Acer yangbiense]
MTISNMGCDQPPQGLQSFTSLEVICIENCSNFDSFLEVCFASHLSKLEIRNCNALTSLPEGMNHKNGGLEILNIEDCNSVTFIVRGQLPSSLKSLKLTMLSSGPLPESLCHLKIEHVPKLESIAERFPQNASLEDICIWDCENLISIPKGLHNLSHLQKIDVFKCPSIVCFPEGGLPTSLREVVISKCEKLQALPDRFHSLNSLQKLRIVECPSMTSFPEYGFPTKITSLEIEDSVNMYKALVEWGLHNLTCLTSLDIKGCPGAESFPQQEMGMLLPDSLTRLNIERFPRLKSLCNHGFQSLTSLESLWISDCSNLICFPEQGLPSSLLELRILRCPLLKEGCKRDKGIQWSKISDIPCVLIDSKFIYDQEVEA